MLANNYFALTEQFSTLVQGKLNTSELVVFNQLINELYQSLESGNSCLELNPDRYDLEQINNICAKTMLVARYGDQLPKVLHALPFAIWIIADKCLLFLTRYLAYEQRVYNAIYQLFSSKLAKQNNLNEIISQLTKLQAQKGLPNYEQLGAIIQSTQRKFNIITGGPGTGKTTTVTLLLWALYQLYGKQLKVKICAPTGKAAIRVKSSINNSIERLAQQGIDISCFDKLLADTTNFGTIHKLLGTKKDSIYFHHNYSNPLDVEVLIIDESSMVGLPLFSKLITAINPEQIKHVILLGDKNQLSSVEEGYVFASLVNLELEEFSHVQRDLFDYSIVKPCSELIVSNRNNELIANLAKLILAGNAQELMGQLHEKSLLYPQQLVIFLAHVLSGQFGWIHYINQVSKVAADIQQVFKLFTQQATLCATNSGMLGTENLNKLIEQQLKQHFAINQEWYTGRAIMILQNDYSLGLFNGDIGICLVDNSVPRIYFENGKILIPEILPKHSLAYAITIHKSQGSEYQHVNVVLPNQVKSNTPPFYSRELLYTAVTRAKESVAIFSNEETLIDTLANPTLRSSGIGYT